MKILATEKREQNVAVLDPWTVVHFSIGLALGLMNAPLRTSMIGAAAYELVEQYFERVDVGKELFDTRGPESIPNALLDLAVLAAGHQLGQMWNRRK
ncbi:MAG: hypothetical protein AB7T31_02260 [Gemmatimonadales bacterium]